MTMHVHRIPGSGGLPFVLDELKSHSRVSDSADDAAIQNAGETAAAECEHLGQLALLTQTIRVMIFDPGPHESGVRLPIGPMADGETPTVTIDGAAFTAFDVVAGIRPYLRWQDDFHALTPRQITIEYQAGFGADASAIPPDLAQAIMDQAALHYDGRSPMDARSLTTSPHMARIAARYRGVQA